MHLISIGDRLVNLARVGTVDLMEDTILIWIAGEDDPIVVSKTKYPGLQNYLLKLCEWPYPGAYPETPTDPNKPFPVRWINGKPIYPDADEYELAFPGPGSPDLDPMLKIEGEVPDL